MDTNKMREQFEAWALSAKAHGEHFDLSRGNHGAYKSPITHWLYCSWVASYQASREAVVVELGAPSHWVADYAACGGGMTVFDAEKAAKVTDPMCSKTPAYTINALEKAGLKVAP